MMMQELIQIFLLVSILAAQVSSAWLYTCPSRQTIVTVTSRSYVSDQKYHRLRRYSSSSPTPSPIPDDELVKDDDPIVGGDVQSNIQTTPTTMEQPQLQLQQQRQQRQRPQSTSPSAQDLMLAMGTNPRRLSIGVLSATGIALAGNFLGVTSKLLTLVPEDQIESIGIDSYFPRGDYKRCLTNDYTFQVPKGWVADTFLELVKAQRSVQPLDYSMMKSSSSSSSQRITTLPDTAYGPPGRRVNNSNSRGGGGGSTSGDTNVSVIVAPGLGNDKTIVDVLGPPQAAAENLLSTSIAPEGSGRKATLIESSIMEKNGTPYYKIEYRVDRGPSRGPPLQNIAIICGRNGNIYTLTVVAPVSSWEDPTTAAQLRKIADSFHLRA